MTWVAAPMPTDHEEAQAAYDNLARAAAGGVDLLNEISEGLVYLAGHRKPEDVGDPQQMLDVAQRLVMFRTQLVDIAGIHKQLLSRDSIDELQKCFALANLAGDEYRARRKELCEEVAGHPVDRLAELGLDEAARLRARLADMEEPF